MQRFALAHEERANAPAPARLVGGIRLEHVSFSYRGADRPVLDDLSLNLRAGAVIAIARENVAGKSTLVKLLCGMYRPSAGRISADGVDLATIAPDAWRAHVRTSTASSSTRGLPLEWAMCHAAPASPPSRPRCNGRGRPASSRGSRADH